LDHGKARELYVAAASKGDSAAMAWIGNQYLYGWGTPKDQIRATTWYRKSAEAGETEAQTLLASRLLRGTGTTANFSEAKSWFEAAAGEGDVRAMEELGELYETARYGYVDVEKSKYWYEKASQKGSLSARSRLASVTLKLSNTDADRDRALAAIHETARAGLLNSFVVLGNIYLKGEHGVATNLTEAVGLFREAAEKGFPEAQRLLGLCHAQGLGVPRNRSEGEKWLKQAAQQGNVSAQFALGVMYSREEGVILADYFQAYKWFRIAQRGGQAPPANFEAFAQHNLTQAQVEAADTLVNEFLEEREKQTLQVNADAR
jgi:TPR repeat protein